MKRTLLMFSVFLAVSGYTHTYAAVGQGSPVLSGSKIAKVASDEETNPNVGVSIGTVEAQLYSESNLNLSYFSNAEYVAQVSEGTYMGFSIVEGSWSTDSDTGEDVYDDSKTAAFVSISSTEESVTIPDNIKIGEEMIPVTKIQSGNYLYRGFTANIKNLTVPATIKSIYIDYNFSRYLDAMYMLGSAPEINSTLNVEKIYLCSKDDLSSYQENEYYNGVLIYPYGWDYDWVTVHVEKNGEFAETYLTQNDYDWSAARNVKVTGNVSDVDLSAIKNLTSLMKLDLSETSITELPESFMYGRTSLVELKLPTTISKIGNYAFYGCSGMQSFELNGVTEIGVSVFSGCTSLAYINLNGVQTIGGSAFYGCKSLNNIDLSTAVSIGNQAFGECSSLESVKLLSATNVGVWCFENCTSLKEVVFGNNLQQINQGAFRSTAIETISLPESLNSIANETFNNCKSLKTVELPSSIETIGYRAFYGCTSLEEITIPVRVTRIGSEAFNYTGIKTFKCYAVVPPTASSSFIGDGMDMTRVYLYVPPFSKDFYRNTQYWSDFYLMRSIEDQIDYILVDRPLTINLAEEDNAVVANNPEINLTYANNSEYSYIFDQTTVGQLTATGDGTLSAGQLTISGQLSSRNGYYYWQYMPTLINYADKMRADNVTNNFTLFNDNCSGKWYFISLPYDVNVSDIVPSENTHWVIRRYDSAARAAGETSSTWVSLTNGDVLEAGKGYIVSAYAGYGEDGNYHDPTLSFVSGNSLTKNNIFRSTDVIVSLTEYAAEFAHNRSWNLIGNPYPCYFDMHYLNEEFTAPVTVWNGDSYVAYSPVDDDLVLSPYEAFFVQCPLDATEITFKEGGRMHSDDGSPLYKVASRSSESISAEDRNVFNFVLSQDKYEDRARIVLNPEAKTEYEIGRDASKFFAESSENAQIYVNADVPYSINERPVNDGVATLGIRSAKEKVYTLSLTGKYSNEWNVMLTDNETGITVDLTKDSYPFTSTVNESGSRFTVRFVLNSDGQTGIGSILADFGEDSNVTVSAVNGVVVYKGRLSNVSVPTSGIYLISNGIETRKVILK